MSEIHQWKMITHEHCRLVSPRVLHKKRRSTLKWCCDDHNVFWGGWDQVCCLLISNSGAGCCSSNFFFLMLSISNFECPHMKLTCQGHYVPCNLTHVGWMHDSYNSLPPQAWAQFLLRMVGLAWSSVQLYLFSAVGKCDLFAKLET